MLELGQSGDHVQLVGARLVPARRGVVTEGVDARLAALHRPGLALLHGVLGGFIHQVVDGDIGRIPVFPGCERRQAFGAILRQLRQALPVAVQPFHRRAAGGGHIAILAVAELARATHEAVVVVLGRVGRIEFVHLGHGLAHVDEALPGFSHRLAYLRTEHLAGGVGVVAKIQPWLKRNATVLIGRHNGHLILASLERQKAIVFRRCRADAKDARFSRWSGERRTARKAARHLPKFHQRLYY